MSQQFLFRGPVHEVELNHLQGANGWLPPYPETDEQTGDDGQVDLDRNAVLAVGQQMTATQDALEPAKEEFHRPAKTVAQGHQLGGQIEATGRQQKDFRTALGIGLADFDFHNPHWLLQDTAALGAAEPDDAVATNAGCSGCRRQRSFFDEGPDGVVADATDEVAAGSDAVLEELLLGIAAIDDVEPLGLQGRPHLLAFRVVASGHVVSTGTPLRTSKWTCILAARCWGSSHSRRKPAAAILMATLFLVVAGSSAAGSVVPD